MSWGGQVIIIWYKGWYNMKLGVCQVAIIFGIPGGMNWNLECVRLLSSGIWAGMIWNLECVTLLSSGIWAGMIWNLEYIRLLSSGIWAGMIWNLECVTCYHHLVWGLVWSETWSVSDWYHHLGWYNLKPGVWHLLSSSGMRAGMIWNLECVRLLSSSGVLDAIIWNLEYVRLLSSSLPLVLWLSGLRGWYQFLSHLWYDPH